MNRPVEVSRAAVLAVRDRFAAVSGQPPRTILLSTILLASVGSAVVGFVLTQYFSVDVLSSLVYLPNDCWPDWGMNVSVGRHCFSDYTSAASEAMSPNPWNPPPFKLPYDVPLNAYSAAAMVPHLIFGFLGKWLEAPRVGLLCYLVVLTVAVLTPAVWAARGARGLERVVVFVACGVVAIPVWAVVNRANSVALVVPIALAFLVALYRQRWGMVTIMVVLAALVKPQFAVLVVALFAARQWRLGGVAVAGGVLSNIVAYALWPRDFPATIMQTVHNTFGYSTFHSSIGQLNASFGKGLLMVPDAIADMKNGGTIPYGYLAGTRSLIGYVVLVVVVVSVLAIGRRIPPVLVGIVLLATASLFPAVSGSYYVVFALPIAALVVRDPDGPAGSGIFARLAARGEHRRAVGMCVSIATALSIVQIAIPREPWQAPTLGPTGAVLGTTPIVATTVVLVPIAWLIAYAAIIVSYARRPAECYAPAGAPTIAASEELTSAVVS